MFRFVASLLDRITMYRLVLYYLIALVAVAVGLSALGVLHYSPVGMMLSTLFLVAICWLANTVFARVFEVPVNVESAYITALILALIITPSASVHDALFLAAAGGLAMASKYILVIGRKHMFNPAAIAVVLTAFGAGQAASWWVGTASMLPFVLAGGVLVVWKIRRGKMVAGFLAATLLATVAISSMVHTDTLSNLHGTLLDSSLFFLAFVMLTEPLTSPSAERQQLIYGALTGVLFVPQIHLGSVYTTPELALVIANAYAYLISPKLRLVLKLQQKIPTSQSTSDFVFGLKRPIRFKPGQYMECTLGHDPVDSRGNRRYFTLASSPTEDTLRLGVKFYDQGSSFKKAMLAMGRCTPLIASQLGGDFVMPDNRAQKLAFIAGGIGITPYRSMLKYSLDIGEQRDIVMIYSEKNDQDIIYRNIFDEATARLGIRIIYTLTDIARVPGGWRGQVGKISPEMIAAAVPDYTQRLFYVSGPRAMVVAVESMLHSLAVPRNHIKTDFFPGY